jgi:hypothetical protein
MRSGLEVLVGKYLEKRALGIPRHMRGVIVKCVLQKLVCESVHSVS